jgi:TP901 family phage tail tape measure protein
MANQNTAQLPIVATLDAKQVDQTVKQLQRTVSQFNSNPIVAKNFTQPLGRITGSADEFTKSLEASNARVVAFGASAGAIYAIERAMSQLVATTIEVEQTFTNIRALTGSSNREFKKLGDGLFQIAKQTGLAFKDVGDSAEEFARQGLQTEQTLKRTSAALTLSRLGAIDAVNATESLTAALNTFNDAALDEITIVNKLAQVDAKFAVSSGDLAEAIKRTGASAGGAKVSFNELLATVTVAQERTARGGAVIGNAFKTIFTRIQRPEVLNQLELIGVKVRDANDQILPAIQILRQYAKVYDTLTPSLKSNTSELLAGVFQVNVLKSVLPELANETGKFDAALRTANETTSEASDRLKLLTDTTKGTLNATVTNLQQAAAEIGTLTIKPAIDNVLKGLGELATSARPENFFGLGESVGKGVYEGIGKVLSGPGLIVLSAVISKIGINLFKFIKDSGSAFLGLNSAAQEHAALQGNIQQFLIERPAVLTKILSGEESINNVAKKYTAELKQQKAVYDQLIGVSGALAKNQQVIAASTGKKGGTGKATGLIPNFVPNFAADAKAERVAASMGGYQAGSIRRMNVAGMGLITYNGNEQVKKFGGLQQPAIMPPALSQAGREYRSRFKDELGFDPYNQKALGFVPNFARAEDGLTKQQRDTILKRLDAGRRKGNTFGGADRLVGQGVAGTKEYLEAYVGKGKISDVQAGNFRANYAATLRKRRQKEKGEIYNVPVNGELGLLALNATSTSANPKMALSRIPALSSYIKRNEDLANDSVQFTGIAIRGLENYAKEAGSAGAKKFHDQISNALADPLASLAGSFSREILGNDGLVDKTREKQLADAIRGKKYISPSLEGSIFEQVARLVTTDPTYLAKSFEGGSNFKDPFDFEELNSPSSRFIDVFGFGKNLKKADAKRTASADQIATLIKKSFNSAILNPSDLFSKGDLALPLIGKKAQGLTLQGEDLSRARREAKDSIKGSRVAFGFVPNFSMDAISSAIQREDRAGVRRDKVRIGYDPRLKKSGGIGVYNTDEGSLANAIDMHLASGRNMSALQTQGKASGFIPNFAPNLTSIQQANLASLGGGVRLSGARKNLQGEELKEFLNAFRLLTDKVKSGTVSFEEISKKAQEFGKQLKLSENSTRKVTESLQKLPVSINSPQGKEAAAKREKELASAKLETAKAAKSSKEALEKNANEAETFATKLIGLSVALPILSSFTEKLKESDSELTRAFGDVSSKALEFGGTLSSVAFALQTFGVDVTSIGKRLRNLSLLSIPGLAFTGGRRFGSIGGSARRGLGGVGLSSTFMAGFRDSTTRSGPFMKNVSRSGRNFSRGFDFVGKRFGGLIGILGKVGAVVSRLIKPLALLGLAFQGYRKLTEKSREASERLEELAKDSSEALEKSSLRFENIDKEINGLLSTQDKYLQALKDEDSIKAKNFREEIGRRISSLQSLGAITKEERPAIERGLLEGNKDVIEEIRLRESTLQKQKQVANDIIAALEKAQDLAKGNEKDFENIFTTISSSLNEAIANLPTEKLKEFQAEIAKAGGSDLEAFIKNIRKLDIPKEQADAIEKSVNSLRTISQGFKILDVPEELIKGFDGLSAAEKRLLILNNLFARLSIIINTNSQAAKDGAASIQQTADQINEEAKKRKAALKGLQDFNKALIDSQRQLSLNIQLLKSQQKFEQSRVKIIDDANKKIISSLRSAYIVEAQNLSNALKQNTLKFSQDRESTQQTSQQELLKLSSDFFSKRLAEATKTNRGTGSLTEEQIENNIKPIVVGFRNAVESGLSGQELVDEFERLAETVGRVDVKSDGTTQESKLLNEILKDFALTIQDPAFKLRDALEVLEKEELNAANIIKLRSEQAKRQIELEERLNFAREAALSPRKFSQNIAQARRDVTFGRRTGDIDRETKGLVDLARTFRGLSLGGFNPSERYLQQITDQFAKNIRLAFETETGRVADEDVLKQINDAAKVQAEALVKPNKPLEDNTLKTQYLTNAIDKNVTATNANTDSLEKLLKQNPALLDEIHNLLQHNAEAAYRIGLENANKKPKDTPPDLPKDLPPLPGRGDEKDKRIPSPPIDTKTGLPIRNKVISSNESKEEIELKRKIAIAEKKALNAENEKQQALGKTKEQQERLAKAARDAASEVIRLKDQLKKITGKGTPFASTAQDYTRPDFVYNFVEGTAGAKIMQEQRAVVEAANAIRQTNPNSEAVKILDAKARELLKKAEAQRKSDIASAKANTAFQGPVVGARFGTGPTAKVSTTRSPNIPSATGIRGEVPYYAELANGGLRGRGEIGRGLTPSRAPIPSSPPAASGLFRISREGKEFGIDATTEDQIDESQIRRTIDNLEQAQKLIQETSKSAFELSRTELERKIILDREKAALQESLRIEKDASLSEKERAEQLRLLSIRTQDQNNLTLAQRDAEFANLQFKKDSIDVATLQAEVNKELEASFNASVASAEDFNKALNKAIGAEFSYNATQARKDFSDLTLGSVKTFKAGVKSAFSEAIKGTSSLREAFKNVFDNVLNNILDKSISIGVESLFGSFGKRDGGLIQKFARGGMVAGGSGVKDDVPAFLQSGEYVIRKSSVNKYGSDFLDTINRGGISQFQNGGRAFNQTLRNEFVYGGDNLKRPTSGSFNRDSRLSAFAITDSNNPMAQLALEREEVFNQYQAELAAYEEQKKAAMAAFKKQQKTTIIKGIISAALAYAGKKIAEGAPQTGTANGQPATLSGQADDGLAKGGLIKAFARGGMNRDNVPALLMGGEYVINKQSVDKYGVNFFDGINKGRLPRFQEGGAVGMAESAGGGSPLNNTNNFSININIDQSGTASVSNDPTDQGASQNTQAAEEEQERNKRLGERIQTVVQAELVDQLRPGGLLYNEKRI